METQLSTYANIKALLESGSLGTARAKITEVTPDGTIVTEADRTALLAVLDGCKPY